VSMIVPVVRRGGVRQYLKYLLAYVCNTCAHTVFCNGSLVGPVIASVLIAPVVQESLKGPRGGTAALFGLVEGLGNLYSMSLRFVAQGDFTPQSIMFMAMTMYVWPRFKSWAHAKCSLGRSWCARVSRHAIWNFLAEGSGPACLAKLAKNCNFLGLIELGLRMSDLEEKKPEPKLESSGLASRSEIMDSGTLEPYDLDRDLIREVLEWAAKTQFLVSVCTFLASLTLGLVHWATVRRVKMVRIVPRRVGNLVPALLQPTFSSRLGRGAFPLIGVEFVLRRILAKILALPHYLATLPYARAVNNVGEVSAFSTVRIHWRRRSFRPAARQVRLVYDGLYGEDVDWDRVRVRQHLVAGETLIHDRDWVFLPNGWDWDRNNWVRELVMRFVVAEANNFTVVRECPAGYLVRDHRVGKDIALNARAAGGAMHGPSDDVMFQSNGEGLARMVEGADLWEVRTTRGFNSLNATVTRVANADNYPPTIPEGCEARYFDFYGRGSWLAHQLAKPCLYWLRDMGYIRLGKVEVTPGKCHGVPLQLITYDGAAPTPPISVQSEVLGKARAVFKGGRDISEAGDATINAYANQVVNKYQSNMAPGPAKVLMGDYAATVGRTSATTAGLTAVYEANTSGESYRRELAALGGTITK